LFSRKQKNSPVHKLSPLNHKSIPAQGGVQGLMLKKMKFFCIHQCNPSTKKPAPVHVGSCTATRIAYICYKNAAYANYRLFFEKKLFFYLKGVWIADFWGLSGLGGY